MGIGNFLSDLANAPAKRRAEQTLAQGQINAVESARPMIGEAWNAQQGMWQPTANELQTGTQNLNQAVGQDYWSQDPSKFNFQGQIEDYLDPSMQFRMNRGVGALDASASAQGGLFSSGHGNEVTDYAQGLASEEYGKAFDKMQTSRNNAYQQYTDFLQNQQARRQGQVSNALSQTNVGMQGTENLSNQRTAYDTSNIANRMDKINAYAGKQANQQQNANLGLSSGLGALGSVADAGIKAATAYYTG